MELLAPEADVQRHGTHAVSSFDTCFYFISSQYLLSILLGVFLQIGVIYA